MTIFVVEREAVGSSDGTWEGWYEGALGGVMMVMFETVGIPIHPAKPEWSVPWATGTAPAWAVVLYNYSNTGRDRGLQGAVLRRALRAPPEERAALIVLVRTVNEGNGGPPVKEILREYVAGTLFVGESA